jgi:hypothetical protein
LAVARWRPSEDIASPCSHGVFGGYTRITCSRHFPSVLHRRTVPSVAARGHEQPVRRHAPPGWRGSAPASGESRSASSGPRCRASSPRPPRSRRSSERPLGWKPAAHAVPTRRATSTGARHTADLAPPQPVASVLPSGLRRRTPGRLRARRVRSRPVAPSQTFTTQRALCLRRVPSGENATTHLGHRRRGAEIPRWLRHENDGS